MICYVVERADHMMPLWPMCTKFSIGKLLTKIARAIFNTVAPAGEHLEAGGGATWRVVRIHLPSFAGMLSQSTFSEYFLFRLHGVGKITEHPGWKEERQQEARRFAVT